eukprot:Pompholyxophrys_punicea_v1_NODE_442_length_1962_cov_11.878343.p1 type:complete len:191 gc:universal NODE_442_length_1962_cov_11.878343:1306-1878(+)
MYTTLVDFDLNTDFVCTQPSVPTTPIASSSSAVQPVNPAVQLSSSPSSASTSTATSQPSNPLPNSPFLDTRLCSPVDIDALFELTVSIIGPLHVSLNTREMVVIKFVQVIWSKFYQHIFGENKKLAKRPKPWRIALILQLAQGGWSLIRQAVVDFFQDCSDPEYAFVLNLLEELVPASMDVYATFFRGNE